MTEEMKSLIDHLGKIRALDVRLDGYLANARNSSTKHFLGRIKGIWKDLGGVLGVSFEVPELIILPGYASLTWRSPKGCMLSLTYMGFDDTPSIDSCNIHEPTEDMKLPELAEIIHDHFPWEP